MPTPHYLTLLDLEEFLRYVCLEALFVRCGSLSGQRQVKSLVVIRALEIGEGRLKIRSAFNHLDGEMFVSKLSQEALDLSVLPVYPCPEATILGSF